jgi:hypothetical protein
VIIQTDVCTSCNGINNERENKSVPVFAMLQKGSIELAEKKGREEGREELRVV